MEELINNQYSDFEISKDNETLIGDAIGMYYIAEPKGDSISCLAILNYMEEVHIIGYHGPLRLISKNLKLYAIGINSDFPIRVYEIQKRIK